MPLRQLCSCAVFDTPSPIAQAAPPVTGFIDAAKARPRLPELPFRVACEALRRLPPDEVAMALRHDVLPVCVLPGLTLYADCSGHSGGRPELSGKPVVAAMPRPVFRAAVANVLGTHLARRAKAGLARAMPDYSASRRLTPSQAWTLGFGSGAILLAVLNLPSGVTGMIAAYVSSAFFLSVIALRLLCLFLPHAPPRRWRRLGDEELPVYSVLVPLYRETAVLGQLIAALSALRYPPGRLDIKLVLEESDPAMVRAVAHLALPAHFDVIVVPSGLPQTKPRALNYALEFVRGAHVAVYDAEDIPDPDQLLRAASVFAASEDNLACLQAELAFYNPNENWLARQFTAEYATLFGLVLPALSAYGLPLPLGGTSNHFRTDLLRRAGGWDAFNVTEDADLGIRLARLGYRTATLCSRTHEEANVALGNWMRQRVRWLKGFIQTWFVHMRRPARLAEELGVPGFLAMQGMIAGVVLSSLLHPVLLALTIHAVIAGSAFPEGASVPHAALAGLGLAVLLLGYGAMIAVAALALRRIGIAGWWPVLLSMPLYWLLISMAGWLALFEFVVKPFRWNKTEHGLSAFQRRPTPPPAGIGAGR